MSLIVAPTGPRFGGVPTYTEADARRILALPLWERALAVLQTRGDGDVGVDGEGGAARLPDDLHAAWHEVTFRSRCWAQFRAVCRLDALRPPVKMPLASASASAATTAGDDDDAASGGGGCGGFFFTYPTPASAMLLLAAVSDELGRLCSAWTTSTTTSPSSSASGSGGGGAGGGGAAGLRDSFFRLERLLDALHPTRRRRHHHHRQQQQADADADDELHFLTLAPRHRRAAAELLLRACERLDDAYADHRFDMNEDYYDDDEDEDNVDGGREDAGGAKVKAKEDVCRAIAACSDRARYVLQCLMWEAAEEAAAAAGGAGAGGGAEGVCVPEGPLSCDDEDEDGAASTAAHVMRRPDGREVVRPEFLAVDTVAPEPETVRELLRLCGSGMSAREVLELPAAAAAAAAGAAEASSWKPINGRRYRRRGAAAAAGGPGTTPPPESTAGSAEVVLDSIETDDVAAGAAAPLLKRKALRTVGDVVASKRLRLRLQRGAERDARASSAAQLPTPARDSTGDHDDDDDGSLARYAAAALTAAAAAAAPDTSYHHQQTQPKSKGDCIQQPGRGVPARGTCANCAKCNQSLRRRRDAGFEPSRACWVARDPEAEDTFKCGHCINLKQSCTWTAFNPGREAGYYAEGVLRRGRAKALRRRHTALVKMAAAASSSSSGGSSKNHGGDKGARMAAEFQDMLRVMARDHPDVDVDELLLGRGAAGSRGGGKGLRRGGGGGRGNEANVLAAAAAAAAAASAAAAAEAADVVSADDEEAEDHRGGGDAAPSPALEVESPARDEEMAGVETGAEAARDWEVSPGTTRVEDEEASQEEEEEGEEDDDAMQVDNPHTDEIEEEEEEEAGGGGQTEDAADDAQAQDKADEKMPDEKMPDEKMPDETEGPEGDEDQPEELEGAAGHGEM